MKSRFLNKGIVAIAALFSCAVTLCSNSFILVNRSRYDIFCRDRSIAQAEENIRTSPENSNIVLKPGERIQLSLNKSYSIRTAGKKTALSQYYDVPKPIDLANATLSREDAILFTSLMWDKGFMPIISVSSGLVYGWKFALSNTWTQNVKEQEEKQGEQWNKDWTNVARVD